MKSKKLKCFFTVQQTCPQCSGSGEEITNPLHKFNGQGNKQVSKNIVKGVDDGTRILLAKGEAGTRGGATGDLYLFINVKSHDLFKRSDKFVFEFPIIADAALGTTIEIPTIDGKKAKIKIPDGVSYQDGKQFRLKGKGTFLYERVIFGDLYVQVKQKFLFH